MSKHRHKLQKLEKILRFYPVRDEENKRFIPYCDFSWHRGCPYDYKVCEERGCNHYYRLYISR